MIVAPLSLRDAFGGRWAWSLAGWAMMLLPGTMVVAVRETSLLHIPPTQLALVIFISSAAQSLAAGFVTAVIVTIARRRWPVIPLALVISVWLTIGVVRGVTGGAVAESVAGEKPLFAQRIVAWTILSLIWMPLFTYAAAQIEHRRGLLAALSSLRAEIDLENSHRSLSATELQSSLAAVIRDRIRPIIDEIQQSLKSVIGPSDVAALRQIGERLSEVWIDAVLLLDPTRPSITQPHDVPTLSPARATIAAALAIQIRRPARTALMSVVAIAPAVIPLSMTAIDLNATRDALLALVVIGAVLFFSAVLQRHRTPAPTSLRFAATLLGYFAAGLCGSVTIAALEVAGLSQLEIDILWLLPLATVVFASCATVAVGIGGANRDLCDTVVNEQGRVARDRQRSEILDATVREQLALLMHGPVQGRLAACVMALNFHLNSNEASDPQRSTIVTSAVIEHLASASRDLDNLPALTFEGRPRA